MGKPPDLKAGHGGVGAYVVPGCGAILTNPDGVGGDAPVNGAAQVRKIDGDVIGDTTTGHTACAEADKSLPRVVDGEEVLTGLAHMVTANSEAVLERKRSCG